MLLAAPIGDSEEPSLRLVAPNNTWSPGLRQRVTWDCVTEWKVLEANTPHFKAILSNTGMLLGNNNTPVSGLLWG